MSRPVTLFTGQWADLTFRSVCEKAASFGYDGLEIACWGDHMDVRKAADDPAYAAERKAILAEYGLKTWALGAHLAGQCVGDLWDPRLDGFAPDKYKGNPEKIRAWAIEELKYTARAAKNMGCSVVTGFMGSGVWKYWYSFPQTSGEMIHSTTIPPSGFFRSSASAPPWDSTLTRRTLSGRASHRIYSSGTSYIRYTTFT